jgi:hypothetical protein
MFRSILTILRSSRAGICVMKHTIYNAYSNSWGPEDGQYRPKHVVLYLRIVCMIIVVFDGYFHKIYWISTTVWITSNLFLTSELEWGEGSASPPCRTLPPGKTQYPLYRRLGGPQGRSQQEWNISPPPGFDPRTVQPVGSRYIGRQHIPEFLQVDNTYQNFNWYATRFAGSEACQSSAGRQQVPYLCG